MLKVELVIYKRRESAAAHIYLEDSATGESVGLGYHEFPIPEVSQEWIDLHAGKIARMIKAKFKGARIVERET